jgi:hypothetical protein
MVLALCTALPAAGGDANGRQPGNLAWVPYAEFSPATTLLGRPAYVAAGYESAKTWAMHKIAVIQAARGDVAGAKNTVAQIGYGGPAGEVSGVWFINGQPVYDRPPAGFGCPPVQGFWPCPLRPLYDEDGSLVSGCCLLDNQLIVPCGAGCEPLPPSPAIDATVPAEQAVSNPDPHAAAAPQPATARLVSAESSGTDAHVTGNFVVRAPSSKQAAFKAATDLPANYLAADPLHGAVVDFSDERDSRGTRVTLRKYADGHAVIETL